MDKRINKFPTLETERLVLRKIEEKDVSDIFEYLSDEEVMRHYGTKPFLNIEQALQTISNYERVFSEQSGIRWGITLKGEDKVIGSCFYDDINFEHCRIDLGYVLNKKYWRQGITKEAVQAIINYGFNNMNINRYQSVIEPENLPSQKLVESLGFQREGLLRDYEWFDGKFDDLYMYSLLKSDFSSRV